MDKNEFTWMIIIRWASSVPINKEDAFISSTSKNSLWMLYSSEKKKQKNDFINTHSAFEWLASGQTCHGRIRSLSAWRPAAICSSAA